MIESLLGAVPKNKQNAKQTSDPLADRLKKATELINSQENSDVLFFGGDIGVDGVASVKRVLREREIKRPKVLLLLTTYGGDPHCAFRIVNQLQQAYEHITIFVNSACMSAGTLMAIGAQEIVMADGARLGPLDIQLAKTDDLIGRMSGLTPTKAMTTLRQQAYNCFEDVFLRLLERSSFRLTVKTASDIAVRLTTGLYEPLYSQLDPLRLAEVERDNAIAKEYGERLQKGNMRPGALTRLISEYPAHEFVIDRTEAAKHIFHSARPPRDPELELSDVLERFIEKTLADDDATVVYLCQSAEGEDEDENEIEPSSETPEPNVSGGVSSSGEGAEQIAQGCNETEASKAS